MAQPDPVPADTNNEGNGSCPKMTLEEMSQKFVELYGARTTTKIILALCGALRAAGKPVSFWNFPL